MSDLNNLYEISTGELKTSTILPIETIPDGWALKVTSTSGVWNTSTLDYDPVTEVRSIPKSAFYKRMSCATRLDIKIASKTDIEIENLLEYIAGFESIDLDDDELIAGLDYLVAEGVITAEKKAGVIA
jgi:hypothetical protein